MPFQSKAQQGFMFAKHPKIAKRWAKETPDMKDLPEKKGEHAIRGLKRAAGKRGKCSDCGKMNCKGCED